MQTFKAKLPLVTLVITLFFIQASIFAQGQSQWRTNGNNANGNNQFLGTTNNTDLKIKTDNQTRMSVKSDGAVEINSLSGTKPSVVAVNPDGSLFRYENPVDSLFDCTTKLYRAKGNYLTPDCFIGSTNKEAFRMYTNNTERMRLASTGELGIGTTTPETPLHFFSATNAELRIQGGSYAAAPTLGFARGIGQQALQLGRVSANLNSNTLFPEFVFEVNNGTGSATMQQVLRMDFKAAEFRTKLGVGMAAPTTDQLAVNGGLMLIEQNNTGNWLRAGHDGANAYIEHNTPSASSNNPSRLYINQNGGRTDFGGNVILDQNLGLGTTTFLDQSNGKVYRLSVDGRIRANEVKVYSGWADYVFEDDYQLMPLAEVEVYIAAHGHLPGMPTSEEVAQNGVELGTTQAKLLEKIEELTLHLIRLEKENAVLAEKVRSIK